MKKLIFLFVCIASISVHAQTSFTVQSGVFLNEYEGGFDDTMPIQGSSLSAGFSVDHSRGKVFGWHMGYSAFNKSFQFGYPITTSIPLPGSSHYYAGYVVKAHELQSALLLRLGKHINLSAGPYLQINTTDVVSGLGIDEDLYFPALPKDLYKRIELGYQGKLQLQFFIGRNFFFGAYANAGASMTDLRTKAWDEAVSYISGQQEDWSSTKLKNIYQHYGICIGIRTKQKFD
jgi:hypothetical protein